MRRSASLPIILTYALMCIIWGTTWLGIRISLHGMPPLTGAGTRFILAGVALFLVAVLRGAAIRPRAWPWKLILVLTAFLFGLNYVLTYAAETQLDSGLVAVLFGTLPFFVFAFGSLAGEYTTARTWIGAAIAFAGVAIISLSGQVRGAPLAALAVIGAAASSGFANVYAKRHAEQDPLVTLPPAMLLAGSSMFVVGLLAEHPSLHKALAPESIFAVLYLALIGSGLAFFCNLWLLQRIAAWQVGLSSLIIPVIAVAVGILVGGEHFTPRELLGSLGVLAGMWIALTRAQRKYEPSFIE